MRVHPASALADRFRRILVGLVLAAMTMTGLAVGPASAGSASAGSASAGSASAGAGHHRFHRLRPIVFVHGWSGSGNQFETADKRFTSNGYPLDYIAAQEYDSTFTTSTPTDLFAALDARIERLLATTGADRVDLV